MARMAILFLLAVILISFNQSSVSAENNEEIIYGLKTGVNLSTLNGVDTQYRPEGYDNLLEPSMKFGLVGGGLLIYLLSDEFSIQPELLFSMKGVTYDGDEYIENRSIWYIELPVLFKTMYEMENNVSGSFYVGPALAYKISSTYDVELKNNIITDDAEYGGISDFDFSAVIGGSMDMKSMGGRLGIDLRYTYGLVNVREMGSIKNGTISITLFYLFDIGKR